MDPYQLTINAFDKRAKDYQDKFMELDLYNDTYDLFCGLIKAPDARIFKIGCGPGNATRYLLTKRPDFQLEAIDTGENMIRLAKENIPSADFKVMDCRTIDQLDRQFDGI